MVSFYFKRRRAFATGVTVCGTGVGLLVCSPVINFLMDTYGWRRTCWILGAFTLNGVPCGMCYRPLLTTGGMRTTVTVHQDSTLTKRQQCRIYCQSFWKATRKLVDTSPFHSLVFNVLNVGTVIPFLGLYIQYQHRLNVSETTNVCSRGLVGREHSHTITRFVAQYYYW